MLMSKETELNINSNVKIKMTKLGREYLSEMGLPFEEDEEGWSIWQLWDVMETFGPLLTPCWGEYCYFESVIKIFVDETSEFVELSP